jgi:hypothetical protein
MSTRELTGLVVAVLALVAFGIYLYLNRRN